MQLKRYRYTGKERDEETGLNYHGARYYAPWLARWCAVDLLEGEYAGWPGYCYLKENPINDTDLTGLAGDDDKSVGVKPIQQTSWTYQGGTFMKSVALPGVTVKAKSGSEFAKLYSLVGRVKQDNAQKSFIESGTLSAVFNNPSHVEVPLNSLRDHSTTQTTTTREFSKASTLFGEYISKGEVKHTQNPILSIKRVETNIHATIEDFTEFGQGHYAKLAVETTSIHVTLNQTAFNKQIDRITVSTSLQTWYFRTSIDGSAGTFSVPINEAPASEIKESRKLQLKPKLEDNLNFLPKALAESVLSALNENVEMAVEAFKSMNKSANKLDEKLNTQKQITPPVWSKPNSR